MLPIKTDLNGEGNGQKLKHLHTSMGLGVGWDFTEGRQVPALSRPSSSLGGHVSRSYSDGGREDGGDGGKMVVMEDASWPDAGLGVGVRHLRVLCQLSLVPFKQSLWCLSLRGSCFMSLIADWLHGDRHEAPFCFLALRWKGGSLPVFSVD